MQPAPPPRAPPNHESLIAAFVLAVTIYPYSASDPKRPVPDPALPLITETARVRSLSAEDAMRRHPVQVEGQVAFDGRHYDAGIVLDASGGIFASGWQGAGELRPGDLVKIDGVSDPGTFAPIIVALSWRKTGWRPLPAGKKVTLSTLARGGEDAQWVEVRGIVRAVTAHLPDRVNVDIQLPEGRIHTRMPWTGSTKTLEEMIDRTVTARGSCYGHFVDRNYFGPWLLLPSASYLLLDDTASTGLETEQRTMPVNRLLAFSPGGIPQHRVKIRGKVLYALPGEPIYIRDGTGVVEVHTQDAVALQPGSVVEATGFPRMGPLPPVLEDAVCRVIMEGPAPSVQILKLSEFENVSRFGDLVEIEGTLLQQVPHGALGQRLIIDAGGQNVVATLSVVQRLELAHLRLGDLLAVRGVWSPVLERRWASPSYRVQALQIAPRHARDIRVEKAAPWMTPTRLRIAVAACSLATIAVLGWTVAVRRKNALLSREVRARQAAEEALTVNNSELEARVEERSVALALEIQARNEARQVFAAILGERMRVAADLHDNLEQSLTGVALQLEATIAIGEDRELSRRHLRLAQSLLERSRLETRRSVWDLRALPLEGRNLADALRNLADEIADSHGIAIVVEQQKAERENTKLAESNLLRIAQEAVTNALKHGHATEIRITLSEAEEGSVLTVADNGRGFPEGDLPGVAEGHFGLSGMRERMNRLDGFFEIESSREAGTRVRVSIPAAHSGRPGSASAEA